MAESVEQLEQLNIDEISSELIKAELLEVVKTQLNSDDVKLFTEHGSKKGNNFVGAVYRIIFKDAKDTDNKSQSSLILKIAPKSEVCREKQKLGELFLREIYMYDEVLAYFNELESFKGIDPVTEGLNEYAYYYSSVSEEYSEAIFLEDLTLRQFEVINHREVPITFDHMALVMKALGKFHAHSFAVKDQHPERFEQMTEPIKEQYWSILETHLRKHHTDMQDRFINILKKENRQDLYDRYKKAIGDDQFTTIRRVISGAAAEPYAVICHGDLTVNNSMFRHDKHRKPIEIQLIDWQFSRYASPVTDLVMYLFCSTSKELRDKHFTDFLKIYHDSLSGLLTRLGSDPQKVFPYEALMDQLRNFGIYTALVGCLLLPLTNAEIDSIPGFENAFNNDVLEDHMFHIPDELKSSYDRKVVDLFDDLATIGCI